MPRVEPHIGSFDLPLALSQGAYDREYFDRRLNIGKVHVRVGVEPRYVEGVMTMLLSEGLKAIQKEIDSPEQQSAQYESLVKILGLDAFVINLAYAEHRLDLMESVTGMSRKLIENLIKVGIGNG